MQELLEQFERDRPDGELTAERMPEQPSDLKVSMKPYQLAGLGWMKHKEAGTNKGGILADDMGLGKTIQSIALILERPAAAGQRRPTLIVAPVGLDLQWISEIEKMVHPRRAIKVVHVDKDFKRRIKGDWNYLAMHDVVVTNPGQLTSELKHREEDAMSTNADPAAHRNYLFLGAQSRFHRFILDEAHNIRNPKTKAAQAACAIRATHRWALTGTIIQNKIDDFQSLVAFMRLPPHNNPDYFQNHIARPFKSKYNTDGVRAFRELYLATTLRRLKTDLVNGQPIVDLPTKTTIERRVAFSQAEADYYSDLESLIQMRINKYLEHGELSGDLTFVFVLLLRLRQACLHPFLTMIQKDLKLPGDPFENARALDRQAVARILQLDTYECYICRDAGGNMALTVCGHAFCGGCLGAWRAVTGDANLTCPTCRNHVDMDKVTDVVTLLKLHDPSSPKIKKLVAKSEHKVDGKQKWISSAKIDETVKLLTEIKNNGHGEKTIIFSAFTSYLDLLSQELNRHEDFAHYARYDGSVDGAARMRALDQFANDPDCNAMLVGLKGKSSLHLSF